jgi:RimJ/RimL family protein N-acetyltransferase
MMEKERSQEVHWQGGRGTCCLLGAEGCNAHRLAAVFEDQGRESERLQALLDSPAARAGNLFFAAAQQDREIVALLRCTRSGARPGRFRIRGLQTRQGFRNRGIATALLNYALEAIFSRPGSEVVYSFIPAQNSASIRAHERAGFRRVIPPFPAPEHHLCYGATKPAP